MVVLESSCYTRKTGTEVVHVAATGFRGIPSGVALDTNSPDNGDNSIYTNSCKGRWYQWDSVIYTRVVRVAASTGSQLFRVHTGSLTLTCLYLVTISWLFIHRHFSHLFITGGDLNHTSVPGGGGGDERLGGWNTPAERLRRRFLEGFLEVRLLADGSVCGWLLVPISTIVGGWSWRSTAAGSGRAASMATLVSRRWARDSIGYTIPDLCIRAPPASRVGQVIKGLAGCPEKGME